MRCNQRVIRRVSLVLVPLALLAGCGGSGQGFAPAAEPAKSPPLDHRPAGRVVRVGHKPEGLAADPTTGLLAVGLTKPDRLALVDMRTGRVVKRVPLPGAPRHLALAGPGGPVLVPAEKADDLVEVSLPSGRKRVIHVGRNPHDADAEPGGRIFVGDELGDTVSVVQGGRRIRDIPAPHQPGGVVVIPGGRRFAAVGVSERAMRLYDARTLRSLGQVDVGVGPTHEVALDQRVFVADTRGGALLWVDTQPRLRIHRRINLPGAPYGMAVDREHKRIWVTLTATNRVAELTDRHVLRTFAAVRQPNSVAVDPTTDRVFVASRKDGTLQIIDPGRQRGRTRKDERQ